MRTASIGLLLALALVTAGCGGSSPSPGARPSGATSSAPGSAPSTPGKGSSRTGGPTAASTGAASPSEGASHHAGPPRVVGTVARDLDVPWGIAFLPDGSALVTERDRGDVLLLAHGHRRVVGHLDVSTSPGGESGLLGIAVSPRFRRDHRVFLYATTATDNRILRGVLREGHLTGLQPILTGIPRGTHHDGGRLVFGPDGYLYASTGETMRAELAQDPGSLGGKILRLTTDGSPAPGNPRPDSPVWTLGHRNVEGLAFDPDGRLWASEFGESTWDELNLIRKGDNYGWPLVEGRARGHPGLTNPKVEWPTSQASPSGLAYDAGSLWLAALNGERLWQVPVHGTHTGKPRAWFIGRYGRMRTVVRAPDGNLWVTTSNTDGRATPRPGDDRILLVRP